MLGNHRGMSLMRGVKAALRWRRMRSGDTGTAAEKLAATPTDDDVDLLYRAHPASPRREDGGPGWGDGAVWGELRRRDPFPLWLG